VLTKGGRKLVTGDVCLFPNCGGEGVEERNYLTRRPMTKEEIIRKTEEIRARNTE